MPRAKAATTTERRALSAERARLEAVLAPCTDREAVDTVVTRLLVGFEQGYGRGEIENEILVAEYVAAVANLPLLAVVTAADRFRTCLTVTAWKPGFRPSPAELAAEARNGVLAERMQLLRIRRVLEAEVYDPVTAEERARLAEAATAHLRRLPTAGADGHRQESPAEIEAVREAGLREAGARLARIVDPEALARLTAHLDARHGRLAASQP